MTRRQSWSFDSAIPRQVLRSVVVSVMLSESKIFRCHELPDWQRWFWLLWAMLPGTVAEFGKARQTTAIILVYTISELWQDWQAGWWVVLRLVPVPVGITTG